MKWLPGTKVVKLSALVLPGEIAQRRKQPHVRERAKSIEANGLIALPVIDARDHRLVVGRDRVAALLERGAKTVEVRQVTDATPEELSRLAIVENLHRRNDDQSALLAELVSLTSARLEADEAELGDTCRETTQSGRPKTLRGRAREEVAAATNRSKEAVARADQRHAAPPPPPPAPPPAERDWIDELPTAALGVEVRALKKLLAGIVAGARKAQGDLTAHQATALGGNAHQRLYRQAHGLASDAAALEPIAVCWACGARDGMATCATCSGLGVVTQEQLDRRPKAKVAAPAANGKHLKIELPDGSAFEDGDDEGIPF